MGRVAFYLRGRSLAAEDTHLTKANSSDPFYKLLVRDSAGKFVCINQSKHISQDLNPTWAAVEVRGDQLVGATELKVEVWDHDANPSPNPSPSPSPNPSPTPTPTPTPTPSPNQAPPLTMSTTTPEEPPPPPTRAVSST